MNTANTLQSIVDHVLCVITWLPVPRRPSLVIIGPVCWQVAAVGDVGIRRHDDGVCIGSFWNAVQLLCTPHKTLVTLHRRIGVLDVLFELRLDREAYI